VLALMSFALVAYLAVKRVDVQRAQTASIDAT
jgi:hypothetical protein